MDFEFEREDGFFLYCPFTSSGTFVLQYFSTFHSKSTKCESYLSHQSSLVSVNSFVVFHNVIIPFQTLYIYYRDWKYVYM
jgi:hypothetical protein